MYNTAGLSLIQVISLLSSADGLKEKMFAHLTQPVFAQVLVVVAATLSTYLHIFLLYQLDGY